MDYYSAPPDMQSVIHTAANSHTSNTTPRRYTPSSRFTTPHNRYTPFTTSTASQRRNTSLTTTPTNTASSSITSNPMNLHLVIQLMILKPIVGCNDVCRLMLLTYHCVTGQPIHRTTHPFRNVICMSLFLLLLRAHVLLLLRFRAHVRLSTHALSTPLLRVHHLWKMTHIL